MRKFFLLMRHSEDGYSTPAALFDNESAAYESHTDIQTLSEAESPGETLFTVIPLRVRQKALRASDLRKLV